MFYTADDIKLVTHKSVLHCTYNDDNIMEYNAPLFNESVKKTSTKKCSSLALVDGI